ncbi:hypothetical protein AUR64_08105 [Haloprofundus marisrubri]|uniref:Uncharacterized protein n=1 Tax=Haloprofundus marisrubri TaxID=1514971 RepID=A0A0W1RBW5_9EURY|nr:hypothetical protein AUR64_08105 [Haloprofundus marisrubri]
MDTETRKGSGPPERPVRRCCTATFVRVAARFERERFDSVSERVSPTPNTGGTNSGIARLRHGSRSSSYERSSRVSPFGSAAATGNGSVERRRLGRTESDTN